MGHRATRNMEALRRLSPEHPLGAALPVFVFSFASIIPLLAVFLLPGCAPIETSSSPASVAEEAPPCPNPVLTSVRPDYLSRAGAGVSSLDLFVFRDDALGQLELYRHCDSPPDTLQIHTTEGDKTLVAVANASFSFNMDAISSADVLDQMKVRFETDNPAYPLMSASVAFKAGSEAVPVLERLMCTVVVASVTNLMKGYVRLEYPRAFLSGMNPEAELLRKTGFCPSGETAEGERVPLPCDIGLFTQYPGTQLHCYPSDTPPTQACPATVLNLEGECRGTTRLMSFTLPPLGRAATICADITFDEYSSSATFR